MTAHSGRWSTGPLFHFTCDHGHTALGDTGTLLPAARLTPRDVPWPGMLAWFTDLATPQREALGLTSHFIDCDRTAHRYRVTDDRAILPWPVLARALTREQRDDLELAAGARPRHWFVSPIGVPVDYDPIEAVA